MPRMEQVRVRLSHRERVMLERVAASLELSMSETVRELVAREVHRLDRWPVKVQKSEMLWEVFRHEAERCGDRLAEAKKEAGCGEPAR